MSNRKLSIPVLARERRSSPSLSMGIKAHHATAQIVSPDGVIVKESEAHNLVLDQGLDYIPMTFFFTTVADKFNYCAVGEGVESVDEEDTGLIGETARVASTSRAGGYSTTEGKWNQTYMFQFAPNEVEHKNLTACIFSWSATAGQNAFSKVVFSETLTIPTGFYLRITYAVEITWPWRWDHTISIPGWGTHSGRIRIPGEGRDETGRRTRNIIGIFDSVVCGAGTSNNNWRTNAYGSDAAYNEGYGVPLSAAVGSSMVPIRKPYMPGSFERSIDLEITLTTTYANNSRSLTFCFGSTRGPGNGFVDYWGALTFTLHQGEPSMSKDNEHILTLENFKISWGRA